MILNFIPVYANINETKNANINIKEIINAKLINEVTGEETILQANEIIVPATISNYSIGDNNLSETKTYEVFAAIPSEKSARTGQSGSKEACNVRGILSINYDTINMSTSPQIRLNTVFGSWTPLDNWSIISQRAVDYGVFPKNGHQNPTTNSFSYSPNWGYQKRNERIPQSKLLLIAGFFAVFRNRKIK